MTVSVHDIAKLIDKQYYNLREPLSNLSRDTENNESMIDSRVEFINYDRLGKELFKRDTPKTPDMVFFKGDTIYFVEFKNGRIEGIKKRCEMREEGDECQYVKWDIKLKALEGAFIVLHRLVSTKIEGKINFSEIFHLRKCFILVYNKYKNEEKTTRTRGSIKIGNHLAAYSIRFGLHIYEGTFFVKVATVTPEVFEDMIRGLKPGGVSAGMGERPVKGGNDG